MPSAELIAPQVEQSVRRFAVAWRNRERPTITPVGVLDYWPDTYRFRYLEDVALVDGFRPFVGFPDLDRSYESARLWPFFNLRVMDRKRPDFPQYVRWLGLSEDASNLDIMSRTGGIRKGDTVVLAEAPAIAPDGRTETYFLARGVSHALDDYNSADSASSLQDGDTLAMVDDQTNEVNSRALLLQTIDGARVGWVPDLLIDYARHVRNQSQDSTVELVQNNGSEAPWHARLLVRIAGHLPPEIMIFEGGVWPSVRSG